MVVFAAPPIEGAVGAGGVEITNTVQSCASFSGLGKILCTVQILINSAVSVILALGVLYFVWGVVQFMIANSEEAKTRGRDTIIYGIIALAVIVSLWGLVNIVVNTLGVSGTSVPAGINVNGSSSTCSLMGATGTTTFQSFLGYITCIINSAIIPFVFAVAVLFFVWGSVKFFIINADEEAKRAQGKQFMIWGIVALAVMLSVWGLVNILGSTFNLTTNVLPHVTPP